MRETVGVLKPSVAAIFDWLSARQRAARTTALVSTLRRSGAGNGVGFISGEMILPEGVSRETGP